MPASAWRPVTLSFSQLSRKRKTMKKNLLISTAIMVLSWSANCLANPAWLGEYIVLPNENIQQIYDDKGEPLALVSVTQLPDGLGLRADFISPAVEPVAVEADGKAFREFLEIADLEPNDIKVDALVNKDFSLFRIPKGSQFKTRSGEIRTMAGEYLFVANKSLITLDLQKR